MKSESRNKMASNKNKMILSRDILIVDDEIPNLQLLTQLLLQQGYQVRAAERPQLAIDSALARPPALILMDVRMPEMDGFEVCKRLKQDERTKDIPVIFISALRDVQDKVLGFEAGGVDFIPKPFQEKEVLARVRTHMELRNMQLNLKEIVTRRTAQIIESEQRFRATFEQAAVGIAHILPDGSFLRVNKKFCDIIGYSEDELLGMTFQEITHPDDLDADLEFVKQLLNGERETYSMDKRYFRKDGSIVWINLTVSLLFDKEGNPKYFISVIKDVSKEREAQLSLEQSEERYRTLFENSQNGIILAEVETRKFKYANPSAARLLGYTQAELCSLRVDDIHPKETLDEVLSQFRTQARGDRGIAHNLPCLRKDGTIIYADISATRVTTREGSFAIGFFVDVTERKQAEEALCQSYDFMKHLTSSVPDAIYSIKFPERIIEWANDSFNVMGYEPEEYVGRSTREFYANPEDYDKVGHLQQDAIRKGKDMIRSEIMARRKDGRVIPAELTATFYREGGKLSQITAMVRDITERKKAEDKIQKAYSEIKQLQIQLQAESIYLQEEIKLEHNFENIIGQSEALKYVLHRVEQVAPMDSIVLILGETGTGKELIARALHQLSSRSKRPLVKVNCAALPRELIESELFGREKGAFTGATTTQTGRFELANGSTLFLDEIGELPLQIQAKLLRIIESGEFERLGSSRTLHSNARIITATNRNLEEAVRKNRFREDLFYRLKIFPITIPPLRDRPEDIPLLVNSFVQILARKMGKAGTYKIPKTSMQTLQSYFWPGNVRELRHAVESALISARGNKLNFDLPSTADVAMSNFKSFEEMEREYILEVLKAKNWKIGGDDSAASTLGMPSSTLRSRIKKLGIKRP